MKKIIIVGAIASLLAAGVMAQEAPAADTVLNMPFSDATGTKDQSASKNNGKLVGKAVVKNNSLVLDGKKSYVDCGLKKSLELGEGSITIIAKIKLLAKQPERSGIVSVGAGSSTDSGYAFMYRVPKKAFYFYVSDGKKRASYQSNSDLLNDDKWHTVAVSFSRGSEVIFALDGKIRGTRKVDTISSGNITNPEASLVIGSWGGSHCLNGSIKDVKIIKKAASARMLVDLTK